MQYTSALVMALATSASAATIKVAVSNNAADRIYTPNDITAAVGDTIEFDFFPKNHTVTQSSFADPCHPLSGGFFSGFVPTTPQTLGSTFTIQVKDTKPIWFYCSQTVAGHCQAGMVGAINAPKTGNTLAAFTKLAANASTSTFPGDGKTPIGGTFTKSSGNSTSGTNSTSTSTSSGSGSGSSTFTTNVVYQTTVTTLCSSSYTSAGKTFTSVFTSTYATAVTSAVATTVAGGSGGNGGSATGTAANPSLPQVTGGAAGFSANMVGVGAVVLGALAMV